MEIEYWWKLYDCNRILLNLCVEKAKSQSELKDISEEEEMNPMKEET